MKIIVTDRESIESGIVVLSSYIVVSIHDPDKRKAAVRKQSGLRDLLHVAFHDAEPVASMSLPVGVKLMTADDAAAIWKFADAHRHTVGAVVVHCEQGMSRSPAVAAAIAKAWALEEAPFWRRHQPNRYVYDLMLRMRESSIQPSTEEKG